MSKIYDHATGKISEPIDSQALCAELQTKLESALATIRLLESGPAMAGIAASLQDVKAGRVKSLSCVQGGCSEQTLTARIKELVDALSGMICHSCHNRIGFTGPYVRDRYSDDRHDWKACAACAIPRAVIRTGETFMIRTNSERGQTKP